MGVKIFCHLFYKVLCSFVLLLQITKTLGEHNEFIDPYLRLKEEDEYPIVSYMRSVPLWYEIGRGIPKSPTLVGITVADENHHGVFSLKLSTQGFIDEYIGNSTKSSVVRHTMLGSSLVGSDERDLIVDGVI